MKINPWGWAALWLWVAVLSGCGGGGGGGGSSADTPAKPTTSELILSVTTLPENTVAMPLGTDTEWLFNFATPMSPEAAKPFVELRDATGTVPVAMSLLYGQLIVKPAQELRLRTDYTLTLKAGLKSENGTVLKTDIVRHFRTILFDGSSQLVSPGSSGLSNFPGQHTFQIADVNGDGRPDIVQVGGDYALLGQGNSFAINVILQNADHSFTRVQNLFFHEFQHYISNRVGGLAVVDLDLDGKPEIVVSIVRPTTLPSGLPFGPKPSGFLVFKQDAQGRYAESAFIESRFAFKMLVTDIDRDGKPDLLSVGQGLTDSGSGTDNCGMVAVLSSAQGALLQPSTALPCGGWEPTIGQLRRGGPASLILSADTRASPLLKFFTLDQKGLPTVDEELQSSIGGVCEGLASCDGLKLIDINGDGVKDLLFTDSRLLDDNAMLWISVYVRDAAGQYKEYLRRNMQGVYGFMVADVDQDGREDIVGVAQSALSSGIVYARSLPTPGLELSHRIVIDAFDMMNAATVAVSDINGDGLPDFVTDSYNSGFSVMTQRKH